MRSPARLMGPFDNCYKLDSRRCTPEQRREALIRLHSGVYRPVGIDSRLKLFAAKHDLECQIYDVGLSAAMTRAEFGALLRDNQNLLDALLGPELRNMRQKWSVIEQIGMTIVTKWGPIVREAVQPAG